MTMRRPWLPPLAEGVGSLTLLLLGLAARYALGGIVPGPFMLTVRGLAFGAGPLGRAGAAWIEERREPAARLPEVTLAVELQPMIDEYGAPNVRRAVADVLRRRALRRGDDHAE